MHRSSSCEAASEGIRDLLDQLEAFPQVGGGFLVGRAFGGLAPGAEPVGDRLGHEAGLGIVMGEDFRLAVDRVREPLLQARLRCAREAAAAWT